jgi:gliding motility-associated-like protein
MSEDAEEVAVSNVLGNPEGVHTYVVRNLPSQTLGLDLAETTEPYFGVFVAALDAGNSFDLSYSSNENESCGLFGREDNSVANWTSKSSPIMNVLNRTEVIKTSDVGDLSVNLGEDEEICPFASRTLSPISNPAGYQFIWQDGSHQSTFQVNDYGTYWVTVVKDCLIETDSITISSAVLDSLFIPNVFTPNNGDELNQHFEIDERILGSYLAVYNRWGKQVYQSSNYQNDWDGADLPVGVYYFIVFGPCLDEKKGYVSILR